LDPATQVDLAPLAQSRGLSTLHRLLDGRCPPRRPSPHGAWPSEFAPLIGAALSRRFDGQGARLLLSFLGPLERGLAAFDLLATCLFSDEEQPLVDELRQAAAHVWPLLPASRWPVSGAALTLPPEELRLLVGSLSEGASPSGANPLGIAELLTSLADATTGGARELLLEATRAAAIELHYAQLSTWASVLLAVLARLAGHRRAAVDLVEVVGSMPRFGAAHAQVEALLEATAQPDAARRYFDGRLFGYLAPPSLRESTVAGLRAALVDLAPGGIDAADALPVGERVDRAAPLTDREAADLLVVALGSQELMAGAPVRPMGQLIDVGLRRPGWRFAARVRLGHLVARSGGTPRETGGSKL